MNGVKYKETTLMRGSKAYELWETSKRDPAQQKKLDQHLRELDKTTRELFDRYPSKWPNQKINLVENCCIINC